MRRSSCCLLIAILKKADSDRGSQYASDLCKKLTANKICKQSMSRKGNCWDNAMAESFFGSLKKELEICFSSAARRQWIFVFFRATSCASGSRTKKWRQHTPSLVLSLPPLDLDRLD